MTFEGFLQKMTRTEILKISSQRRKGRWPNSKTGKTEEKKGMQEDTGECTRTPRLGRITCPGRFKIVGLCAGGKGQRRGGGPTHSLF